jgi:hypothetical protein
MRKLRGHHLICLHFYDGEGYDEPFIENLEEVIAAVKREGVVVAEGADDVCSPCPHRTEDRCTYSRAADREIREMDRKALALLDLGPGGREEWKPLRETVEEIFPVWHKTYCFACSWRPVCEKNELFRRLAPTHQPPSP